MTGPVPVARPPAAKTLIMIWMMNTQWMRMNVLIMLTKSLPTSTVTGELGLMAQS